MARSKGQGATEYLVILGAVLLVAMVIIALLGWFPQVGGPSREKESQSYWKTATPFSITTVQLGNGTALLMVANRGSDKLNITEIQFDDGSGNVRNLSTGYQLLTAGEEKAIYITGFTNGNPCVYTATGKMFEITQVNILYNFMTYSMRQTGARPLIGTCA
ncbi:MAG: hypothetical protein WCX64_01580 [Candidatus Micrarchaeia archaeon]